MKKKSVFEDIIVVTDGGGAGIYDIASECNMPSRDTCVFDRVLLRPVAWSWFYLGEHVTTDKAKAEELLSFGESLQPLYTIIG